MNNPGPASEAARQERSDPKLSSLLYISRSTIAPRDAAVCITNIVATSLARNLASDVTGALLFTGQYFAQVLEGTDSALDALMASINRDPRHEQILVVAREPIVERRFLDWSLAYFGPSQFVSRHVTRLLEDPSLPEYRRSAEWLNELLWEFSTGAGEV